MKRKAIVAPVFYFLGLVTAFTLSLPPSSSAITSLNSGNQPTGVAVNSATNQVFVTNNKDNTVTVIDLNTFTVSSTIAVGSKPGGVAIVDDSRIIVANKKDNTVSLVNTLSGVVTATINVGKDPENIAVDSIGNRALVTNHKDDTLSVISLEGTTYATVNIPVSPDPIGVAIYQSAGATLAIVSSKKNDCIDIVDLNRGFVVSTVSVGRRPAGVAVHQNLGRIVVVNQKDNTVTILNTQLQHIQTIPVSRDPLNVAINTTTNKAFITNSKDDRITIIDLLSNTVTGEISVENKPTGIALNSASNIAVVTNSDSDSVSVIHLNTEPYIISTPSGNKPYGLDIHTGLNMAVIANKKSNDISFLDLATNTILKTIPVEKKPLYVAIDESGKKAFIVNKKSNTVSVVDIKTGVVSTITVGDDPKGVAFNPTTAQIVVSNEKDNNISIINLETGETFQISVGKKPQGVAIDSNINRVVVANKKDDTVSIIDLTTPPTHVATVSVGRNPADIAVNPLTHMAVVSNKKDDSISVIDIGLSNLFATSTIAVSKDPEGVAINQRTNQALVVSSHDREITLIDLASMTIVSTVYIGEKIEKIAVNHTNNTAVVTGRAKDTVVVVALSGQDITPPNAVIASHRDGQIVSTPAITVTGSVDDPTAAVFLNDTPVSFVGDSFTVPSVALIPGANTLTITTNDPAGNTSTSSIAVILNRTPVANAGIDQSADEGTLVILDGSISSDPDGQALSYSWTGPLSLTSSTSATPSFTAPSVMPGGTSLTFNLIINDGIENSVADSVTVTINNVNNKPVADAGIDQTISENTTVTLDGSGSSDLDGETISYAWIQTSGAPVLITDASTASPSFTGPAVSTDNETLVFQLVVNDSIEDSLADTVSIAIESVLSPEMTELSRLHLTWGNPNDAALQVIGDKKIIYIVLNESDTSLVHFDVTDPTNPLFLGGLPSPGWSLDVQVHENYVYNPGSKGQISILDANDPTNITSVQMFKNGTNDRIKGVKVFRDINGDRIGLSDSNNGAFQIWNFNDLTNPVLLGQYAHPAEYGGTQIELDQQQKYVYILESGVKIYDISNLANPVRVAHITTDNGEAYFRKFTLSEVDNKLYLPSDVGVSVYNISNPAAPLYLSQFEPNPNELPTVKGFYFATAMKDNYLYLAGKGHSEILETQTIHSGDAIPQGYEVIEYIFKSIASAPAQEYIVVAKYSDTIKIKKGGIQVIDMTDTNNPIVVGSFLETHDATLFEWIKIEGNLAYTIDVPMGLRIFDISNPFQPIELSSAHSGGEADDVIVMGDYAYISQNLGGGMYIVNVSDKQNPQVTSYYHTGGEHYGLVGYMDKYVYLGVTKEGLPWGLDVVDVSDPFNPVLANRLPINAGFNDGFIDGKYLFTNTGSIYDLSNPIVPFMVGMLNNDPLRAATVGIEKFGQYIYLAAEGRFQIVDAASIYGLGPKVIGEIVNKAGEPAILPTSGGWSQTVVVDPRRGYERVYICLNNGIGVIDVTNPKAPLYLGAITSDSLGNLVGSVTSMVLSGDHLYVNNYYGHLHEFDVSAGIENLSLVKKIINRATYVSRPFEGYIYKIMVNGMDIISAPNSLNVDTTPPPAISALNTTIASAAVKLSWTNPIDPDFAAVKIVRKTGSFPSDLKDGDLVYDGNAQQYLDYFVEPNTTYYYKAFAYDGSRNHEDPYSAPQVMIHVADTVPPASILDFSATGIDQGVNLFWNNPADLDLAGVAIVRGIIDFPVDQSDGVLVYNGAGNSFTDLNVVAGTTYYYTIISYDTSGNYSLVVQGSQDFSTPGAVLFSDDFEAEIPGQEPSRWLISYPDSGTVMNDTALPSWSIPNTLGSNVLGGWNSGDQGWFIDDPANPSFTTPTIHFKIMEPDNGYQNGEKITLFFGYQDENNYSKITILPHYFEKIYIDQKINGLLIPLREVNWSVGSILGDGQWHQVKLILTLQGPELYVAGNLVFKITNQQFYARYAGMYYDLSLNAPFQYTPGKIGFGGAFGLLLDDVIITE